MGVLAKRVSPEINSQYVQDESKCSQYGYSPGEEAFGEVMPIAWAFLSDIQKAQLLRFRPDLEFEYDVAVGILPRCPRGCGGKLVRDDGEIKCLLCERVFNERGEEIKPALGNIADMRKGVGFRHG